MKFRIIIFGNRYMPQVLDREIFNGYQWEDKWVNIGFSDGFSTVGDARDYCQEYKCTHEERVVEEFYL